MKHASRDLPRVIHTAMFVVIISYLLANIAYYLVLPGAVIGQSNTIAVVSPSLPPPKTKLTPQAFGTKVFGSLGGLFFALAVSLSCFGALNATAFTTGRLVYAAGKEGYLPSIFGTLGFRGTSNPQPQRVRATTFWRRIPFFSSTEPRTYSWSQTPIYAILLNAALTGVYIAFGEFGTLLTFYGVAGYTFYFLTVLGLVVLRVKEPDLERPYRTWIVTPIVFCCVSLFLVSRSVFSSPLQTMVVVGFVGVGVPVYYWRVGRWPDWRFWRGWGRR